MKAGKDSVVYGYVAQNSVVGDGAVVIGPTDANGNTIINQPMAIGRNAQAGPGCIAIGAGATAGVPFNLPAALHELKGILETDGVHNNQALTELTKIITELSKPMPDRSVLQNAWNVVKTAATIDGVAGLAGRIAAVIGLS